jgi:hypothetical protein
VIILSRWIQSSESSCRVEWSQLARNTGKNPMIKNIERFMHNRMATVAVDYAIIAGGLSAAIIVVAIRLAIK